MFRKTATAALSACLAAVCFDPANAEGLTSEQMMATIRALQARVEALEAQPDRSRARPRAARTSTQETRSAPIITKGDQPITASQAVPPVSSFDGPYAALFGGYQFGSERKPLSEPYFQTGSVEPAALSSSSAGVAIGYNRVLGDILIGAEGRFRGQFGETSAVSTSQGFSNFVIPFVFSSSCCGPNPIVQSSFADFQLSNELTTTTKLTRQFGGDVSARIGMIWDEWLIYGKFGGGANSLRISRTEDRSGSVKCVDPIVRVDRSAGNFASAISTVTGCASQTRGPIATVAKNVTAPYTLVGIGVERNFGPMFVRIEGNLYVDFTPRTPGILASQVAYSTEALGAIGYRF